MDDPINYSEVVLSCQYNRNGSLKDIRPPASEESGGAGDLYALAPAVMIRNLRGRRHGKARHAATAALPIARRPGEAAKRLPAPRAAPTLDCTRTLHLRHSSSAMQPALPRAIVYFSARQNDSRSFEVSCSSVRWEASACLAHVTGC